MKKLFAWLTLVVLLAFTLTAQVKIGGTGKIGGTAKVGVEAGGGLTDFVADSFTEASDTALASHTGETGATWTVHPSYAAGTTVDAATDRIFATGDPQAYYASGVPPSANYTVCADVFMASALSVNTGPCGRMSTTLNTMYCLRYNETAWQLRKLIDGAGTVTLGSSTNQLITVGNSKRACVVMNGTDISGTVEGVTEIGPITDSAITDAGRAGFRSAGVVTSTTGFHLDNLNARGL